MITSLAWAYLLMFVSASWMIRSYALRAEENGSLQERNRIAREIHDSLGHSLTALNLHLEMALKLAQI